MEKLTNISNIKKILHAHGFTFKKSLGQNFLINPSVCPKISKMAESQKFALEIGAGIGVLTRELAKSVEKVVAIELDQRLIPILNETLAGFDNVKIIHGDIMKLDLQKIIAEEFDGKKPAVCANLPYYITSPVIMMLLEQKLPISTITVMVQKEAALRITAAPGTRESGAISYAVSYYSTPKLLFNVSAGSFMPAPKVDSAVITLDVKTAEQITQEHSKIKMPLQENAKANNPIDEKLLFKCIKAGFSQRRKTLPNALASIINKQQISAAMELCGISPLSRAEQLRLEDFIKLSETLRDKM